MHSSRILPSEVSNTECGVSIKDVQEAIISRKYRRSECLPRVLSALPLHWSKIKPLTANNELSRQKLWRQSRLYGGNRNSSHTEELLLYLWNSRQADSRSFDSFIMWRITSSFSKNITYNKKKLWQFSCLDFESIIQTTDFGQDQLHIYNFCKLELNE
jgi:hypothetical protein